KHHIEFHRRYDYRPASVGSAQATHASPGVRFYSLVRQKTRWLAKRRSELVELSCSCMTRCARPCPWIPPWADAATCRLHTPDLDGAHSERETVPNATLFSRHGRDV